MKRHLWEEITQFGAERFCTNYHYMVFTTSVIPSHFVWVGCDNLVPPDRLQQGMGCDRRFYTVANWPGGWRNEGRGQLTVSGLATDGDFPLPASSHKCKKMKLANYLKNLGSEFLPVLPPDEHISWLAPWLPGRGWAESSAKLDFDKNHEIMNISQLMLQSL